jgi:hypothetical protein
MIYIKKKKNYWKTQPHKILVRIQSTTTSLAQKTQKMDTKKPLLDLVGKQSFTFNGEPHKKKIAKKNKAQVAKKIVGRQIFMSKNTKHENLAISLPPKNSSIETLLLEFVGEQSFTSHDGPNKRMKTLHLL